MKIVCTRTQAVGSFPRGANASQPTLPDSVELRDRARECREQEILSRQRLDSAARTRDLGFAGAVASGLITLAGVVAAAAEPAVGTAILVAGLAGVVGSAAVAYHSGNQVLRLIDEGMDLASSALRLELAARLADDLAQGGQAQ